MAKDTFKTRLEIAKKKLSKRNLDKNKQSARLLDKFFFNCQGWIDPDSSIDIYRTLNFNGLIYE